jgi:chromosome segregation ATPase
MTTEENSKMKDLLIKLQILTNGIVEERKKSKNYLDKIKELEKILQQKDNELVELTKQKFDLQASLTFEKSKQPTQTNKKKKGDETSINTYEQIINNQGAQLNEYKRKLKNKESDFNEQLERFRDLIKIRTEELAKEKEKYKNLFDEHQILLNNKNEVDKMLKNFEAERQGYKDEIDLIQKEKNTAEKKNVEYEKQLEELRKKFDSKEKEIVDLKKNSDEMAIKLNQMKMQLVEKELKEKKFKVEVIKPKKIIEMIFSKNKETNNYEIIIKGRNKKDSEEHINILDINSFLIDQDKSRVDIDYVVSQNIVI